MPGSPDWAGTALLHGATLVSQMDVPIAAAGSFSQYLRFTKPGYLVVVSPQYSGASGATPFARVHWQWEDANPATADLGYSRWVVPIHAANTYVPVIGSGPVRGQWLQLRISNLDAGQPILFGITVYETTQHIARDDWRETDPFGFFAPPGFTVPPGAEPGANQLASVSTTLTATTSYLLPLYAGQAFLSSVMAPVAGGTLQVGIMPYDISMFIYESPATTTNLIVPPVGITLPRKPCILQLVAPASGGNFDVTLTSMEFAS